MKYEDRPWLTTFDPNVPRDVDLPVMPVYKILTNSFENCPQNVAIYYYGCEILYSDLESYTNKFANSLASLGIKKGDRVAIFMDNCPQYIIAFYSILKVGGIVVQTSPLLTERELLVLLNDSEPKGIVTLDYLLPRVLAVKDKSSLEFVVDACLYDFLPVKPFPSKPFRIPDKPLPRPENIENSYTFMSLLNQSCSFDPIDINPHEDIAVIQYSSGTTGIPKGVMVSHYNITSYASLLNVLDYKSEYGKEIYPVNLPISHNYGMYQTVVLPMIMAGKMLVMVHFHPDQCLEIVHQQRPTVFRTVPTILTILAHHSKIKEYDLSSIRHWLTGGAPASKETVDIFQSVSGANVCEGYGLTETTSGMVVNSLYGETQDGIGMPFITYDARVINSDTGEEVPFNEDGELLIKGPTVALGYWRRPEDTAAAFRDGWFYTGDMVRMSEEGVLKFVDRIKEMVIVAGFNVYPREVETVISEHPAIKDVACIGVPDTKKGEVVEVFIALRPGMTVSEEEIISLCKEKLSPYKVPRYVEIMSELPKNASDKIMKKEIKRMRLEQIQGC